MTVYGKRGHFTQTKKIEFFILIKSYKLSQLSAKILEGKTFDAQRNWQLTGLYSAKQLNYKSRKHKLNFHFRYNQCFRILNGVLCIRN